MSAGRASPRPAWAPLTDWRRRPLGSHLYYQPMIPTTAMDCTPAPSAMGYDSGRQPPTHVTGRLRDRI